jgi:glycosyltransferase involved in cell wall biosynthesis
MRLLVANFFPAFFPPSSGGEQRYFWLYRHLSRWHDVTLFSTSFSDKPEEVVEHSRSFREYRVPRPPLSGELHQELHRAGIGDECSALVVAIAGAVTSEMRRRFSQLAQFADVVIHESPFTFPLDESAYSDRKPRVYASYNVEHRLAAQMLKGESGRAGARFIRFLEGLLVSRADLVFATSEEERAWFRRDFGCDPARVLLAPNGFEPHETPASSAAREPQAPYAVFLGSGHPPNIEAATHICESLAPALPAFEFRILGSVCARLNGPQPPNVRLLGFVEEGAMRSELAGCTAALNPLFSGAGTNLKMLQYMEAGAPILTTPLGARGLDLEPDVEALVLPMEEFPARLAELAATPDRRLALGAAARRKAYARFTWEQIAEAYSRDLQGLAPAEAKAARPHILVVNDFAVTDRRSGGEARIFELLRELSVDFEVELLCLTDRDAPYRARISDHAHQSAFPKSAEHRAKERGADAGQPASVRDIVAGACILKNEAFVSAFVLGVARSNLVIFEHPYLAPLTELLPPHVPVVYSALNVEEALKRSTLARRADAAAWAERAAELERRIVGRASAIVAVCDDDAAAFRKHYPEVPILVVENGTHEPPSAELHAAGAAVNRRPVAVFLGSGHPPNLEAASRIVLELAPRMPSTEFHLIGDVGEWIRRQSPPENVISHGVVTQDRKVEILRGATVAINPMTSGGGSSLKVPDFLAAGLPLISTRMGARGFGLKAGVDYVEAEVDDFTEELRRLLEDPARRAKIAFAGRRAARRLTWPVLGSRYRRFARALMRESTSGDVRLLVVTYRLMYPAPGGAESYLNNLLANLGRLPGITVDVAACDVGTIQDHWHFSALYGPPPADAPHPLGAREVFRFPVDPPDPDAFSKCRQIASTWMRESRGQSAALFESIGSDHLLGGWNFPEKMATMTARWSSRASHIGVTAEARAIRIDGHSPESRRVDLRCGTRVLASTLASGSFSMKAELDQKQEILELAVERPLPAPGDSRELGVSVQRIAIRKAGGWVELDLAADAEAYFRRNSPDAWIDTLVTATEERRPEIDEFFLQVRGPHSTAMREWLQAKVQHYDAVLVQGAPFAPLVWAPPIARSHQVPVVLLPHYHVEDRYYHWKGYYRAFRDADRVLAFPDLMKRQFFDKIDAAVDVVGGGGLDLQEFEPEPLERGRREFEAIHRSSKPYVLVLGRKSGGKRYELVLECARLGDPTATRFDIVMIGPDDDGKPVRQAGVHYYGPRSREFVIGALAGCVCLVNMSESESFGIVLLEAWAAGRPVIAQRLCLPFRDLVDPGVNGYLAETPQEIREHIDEYIDDPDKARRHGVAGGVRAMEYSWASIARRVRDIVVHDLLKAERMSGA